VPVVVQEPSVLWQLPSLLEQLGHAGLVVVLVIFMLIRYADLRSRLLRLAGYGRLTIATKALDEAGQCISRYLLMQSIINGSFGLAAGVGLFLIGVPYALLWGVLAAVLRFIPYVGPVVAAFLPSALSLAAFPGWVQPLLVIGLILLLELASHMVMEPLIIDTTRAIVDDLDTRQPQFASSSMVEAGSATKASPTASVMPILGCPAQDEADELALLMLRQLLDPTRYRLEIVSAEVLTAEVLSMVERQHVRLICIAALPPGALAPTRYLCKRLRACFPDCKIVVGRWGFTGDSDELKTVLQDAGADDVGLTLRETREQVVPLGQLVWALAPEPPSVLVSERAAAHFHRMGEQEEL